MLIDWALIAGCSHAEIPLVLAARRLGLKVATLGGLKDGPAHEISDRAFVDDFSSPEHIIHAIETLNPISIVPGANDFSYLACAQAVYDRYAQSAFGFDTPSTARAVHHKGTFRELQNKYSLPSIKSVSIPLDQSAFQASDLQFPLICKPIDLSGGKGITIIRHSSDLQPALEKAKERTRAGSLVIEEYLDGTHHSAFMLFKEGAPFFSYFADEYFCDHNPFMVCGASTSTALTQDQKDHIAAQVSFFSQKLGLADGLIHTQFVITKKRLPTIIEVTRRSPGDLYLRLVELATKASVTEDLINLHSQNPPAQILGGYEGAPSYLTRHCIWATGPAEINLTPENSDYIFNPKCFGQGVNKKAIIFRDSTPA